jgi:hypothetical protein
MWQYPNMLPKLYTWGPVVAKLMEGAGKITSNYNVTSERRKILI